MKIYTKKGDSGKTSLGKEKKFSKDDPIIEAFGDLDELNSQIGVAVSFLQEKKKFKMQVKQLQHIQQTLFSIGASLHHFVIVDEKKSIDSQEISLLEGWIDEMYDQIPKINRFIIPGGTTASATLHLARAVCRRAERAFCRVYRKKRGDKSDLAYLNRLSDFLFVCACYTHLN